MEPSLLIHHLQECTNWVDVPKGITLLFSHGYFNVRKPPPEKIAIKIFEDDIWEKGIYVTFISLNDIIWDHKDRWVRAKKIGKE